MKTLIILMLMMLGFISSNAQSKPKINPFFSYNFGGLENYLPSEQVKMLKNMGYDGMCLQMAKAEHVQNLDSFLKAAGKYPDFKIYAAFVRYNFQDEEVDKNRWKEVVDKIQGAGIALWFIFGKPQSGINDEQIKNILLNVVEYACEKQVPVVLYPHSNCYFYSAEQALPMIQEINHPNLKLAVHLCHELRAGNGNRMNEVIKNVQDYLSFVTIAGANKKVDRTSVFTIDKSTIQPLYAGNYNFKDFFYGLKEINYKGPVGFINFKIDKKGDNPEDYLPKTLRKWNSLKYKYLKYKI